MWETPLFDAVKNYAKSQTVPFHMPGHKLGIGLPTEFSHRVSEYDITEIPGTDNLHYPEDAILKAEKLAASAFGADKTYFLVNGSTCGILAAIRTVCNKGDTLIIGRDCHKSVFSALVLWGVKPVYVKPDFNSDFGISSIIRPDFIRDALKKHPKARGVLITRPNYYGICSDIKKISDLVHSYGKILIVDEAHGAHFGFCKRVPPTSIKQGADLVIQSAHKTLPALTQGAYLHVNGRQIDTRKLKNNLRMLQTSSPSYPVLCSLDIARAIMQERGDAMLTKLLEYIDEFNNLLGSLLNICVLTQNQLEEGIHDPTRIVVQFKGLCGYEAERILRERYSIQVEMSDLHNIVCIATVSDKRTFFKKLFLAVRDIANSSSSKKISSFTMPVPDIPKASISIEEASLMPQKGVGLKDAAGQISGEFITPYPPGIPLVVPGELITKEVVEYVYNVIYVGGKVNGIDKKMVVNILI